MTAERGRPRSFDPETALQRATEVFWRHGFKGTSMAELTATTGLSKPSLYAAFGDKESLYLQCLKRYLAANVALQNELLEQEADARRAVESFMRAMARVQTDPALPGGCLVVTGTTDCGAAATPAAVDAALRAASGGTEERLLQRLERAERDGQLPAGLNAKALATLLASVLTGMAVLAKSGQPRKKLDEVVSSAMAMWPAAQPAKRPRRVP
ncbi:TetR/AcrR family transcriptional regulator [Piscinibacter sp.]|uniref:TetR/AcrR family transcriptional regulator n=1 Tax=Piscinibacter sp. TaxID=1903157 RepID=UPI002BEECE56|nr:TetR/AcrR family transcriptional regulator [Albitalea sp.]HUG21337.1 TetR/AcrR family transcriptional regulator [Albitalea sp.]